MIADYFRQVYKPKFGKKFLLKLKVETELCIFTALLAQQNVKVVYFQPSTWNWPYNVDLPPL